MLYSENELNKRLKAGCGLYYFYASDEALVHNAAQKALKFLNQDDPETTVLDGPTPAVEEIVLAAGTISFFGGRRLVLMPLVRPSTYSDKDLQELCDTLSDTENAIFVMTSVVEESYGKLRPGKREQKLITACEKLGYCVQINKPTGAALQAMARDWAKESGAVFAPGAENALLTRCGDDQFLLKNEVEKLAALANYGTITPQMVSEIGTVTLDADTFDMVKLLTGGQADKAQQKMKTLLALQNAREPFDIVTGKRKYSNMLLEKLTVTTTPDSEHALMVTAECREVIIVRTQVMAVPAEPGRHRNPAKTGGTANKGQKQAVPVR